MMFLEKEYQHNIYKEEKNPCARLNGSNITQKY